MPQPGEGWFAVGPAVDVELPWPADRARRARVAFFRPPTDAGAAAAATPMAFRVVSVSADGARGDRGTHVDLDLAGLLRAVADAGAGGGLSLIHI